MRLILALLLLLSGRPALADDASDAKNIVGVWKLVWVVEEERRPRGRGRVLGEHRRGGQIARADGQWLARVTADGRKVPQTDEERAEALRTMIAYTGRYRVEGGKVITKVEM